VREHHDAASIVDDAHTGAVVAGHAFLGQHLLGSAEGHDPALDQQGHAPGVLAGQGEVVQGRQHGEASSAAEVLDQVEHLLLAPDIE